ncbi:biogenesis of lysosome-related organelles complex 1 subunit 3 [Mactra antiquata]
MDVETQSSKIIVEGEASESDEDDNVQVVESSVEVSGEISTDKDIKVINKGVVVTGEAPESDEEFEIVTNDDKILPLNVNTSQRGDNNDDTHDLPPSVPVTLKETKPKYNTLLNKKLRERNVALRRHIVDTIHQSYLLAAKDIKNLNTQLQKSHIAIQDVSHHMRNVNNDLFHLEDKVDIVRTCFILPDFNIPSDTTATTTTTSDQNQQ